MAIIANSIIIKPVETVDSIIIIFGHALLLSLWSCCKHETIWKRPEL